MTVRDPAVPLLRRLDLLHVRAANIVRQRAAGDASSADPLRGLYLPPEVALQWAHRPSPGSDAADAEDDGYPEALEPTEAPEDRLTGLAHRFMLPALDVHLLLAALAPDVDRRFEPLYGYLNDDVSRRRVTVSVALELIGLAPHHRSARARMHPAAPLLHGGLMTVEDDRERPLPGRTLRVPERVIAYLLGDDVLDSELLDTVRQAPPLPAATGPEPNAFEARLAKLLPDASVVVHLREHRPGTGVAVAVAALQHAGRTVLRFDLPSPTDSAEAVDLIPALVREARLREAALVISPLPEQPAAVMRALEHVDVPVVLVDPRPFDPHWSPSATAVLSLDLPPGGLASTQLWAEELGEADVPDLAAAVAPFRLGPDQVRRAVRSARALAALDSAPLSRVHIQHGARQQSAPLLNQHARQVQPEVGWPDLVLPDEPLQQLHELVVRARQRERVLREWRLRPGGGRGRGVVALFAGDSGTGKTLSAEVVAGELGVVLYVVELSSVVDKYIGETEKNLERIFAEADRTDSVLLFDEADAIFGKRSEVKDSHDRYANMESAFLLQRLESFDGIALLTTNLRANIDEAFTRRLDLIVDFPFPDPALRTQLWRQCLTHAPCLPDLDLAVLGDRYELSGGGIRSAAVTAAYLAAGRGEPISDDDVLIGAQREYQKMGRVVW
ncbi:ATP-binding protein [Pseudonocardia xinjiangensis]|uniref:ATP-binding protein n=1 Tax=Pseudonocardia xinjiangensis TaxID=75289 RepID=UPI003D92D915